MNVGFVGSGGIAQRHLGVLEQFDGVRVAAFADPDAARAGQLAARVGAASYTDHRAMLDREPIDALFICVPPFAHGEPEHDAVELNIPFLVEKPLSRDLKTAERTGIAIEQRGLVTAAGYHWRYMDTVEEAQHRLADNPARLALGYWLADTPPPAWWHRRNASGGQTVEQTTHIIDLARLLVGEVERVYATGSRTHREDFPNLDVDDASAATLEFATGAVGNIASTCLLNWGHRVGLHLFSPGMAIELHEHEMMIDVGQGRPTRGTERDPVVQQDRDFLNAAAGGDDRIRVSYTEALRTHRVALGMVRSAANGEPVQIQPYAEGAGV